MNPKKCTHCGRLCRDYNGGYASVSGKDVCHPNEPNRPDCYHLITVYHHQLDNCESCSKDPWKVNR